jgi:deoxyadenosine/deoxycytidine kinase/nucleoside 2-deoxyribosyltransferase
VLCVSGISGSGKTSLAEVIARTFGIERLGSHPTGRAYLQDLARNQERWAFEAQVAFLVSKTSQIRQKLDRGEPMVVERWIDEDILVYERLFEETGAIGPRGQETFKELGDLARDLLQPPEYHFYCECSADTAYDRTHKRKRSDSRLHTLDYIRRSKELYENWLDRVHGPEVYILNTDASDLSKPGVIEEVFREVQWVLTHDLSDPQIPLFDEVPSSRDLKHIRPYHSERWSPMIKTRRKVMLSASPLVAPVAYLAAPFSGRDTIHGNGDSQATLFEIEAGHGIIPRSGFRNDLLGIERALRQLGLSVLLPHRDVNEWGRKQLRPDEAMRECTHHVSSCDLFVGLLGNSCGAHYEFGLALAAGKPCILIQTDELSSSFLADGASTLESDDVIVVRCKRLRDAEQLLETSMEIRNFVERQVGREISLLW